MLHIIDINNIIYRREDLSTSATFDVLDRHDSAQDERLL